MTDPTERSIWTADSIAQRFNLSIATVYAHHRRGTLPQARKLGRSLMWTSEQVEQFGDTRRRPGRPPVGPPVPEAPNDAAANAPERTSARALGAFYTPPALAAEMVRWLEKGSPQSIVEPSGGDGEFIRAYKQHTKRPIEWYAHEIDGRAAAKLRQLVAPEDGHVIAGDFLRSHHRLVDGVIGNPPFVRLRNLPIEEATTALSRSKQLLGHAMENSGSVWLPFVLHATSLLARGGDLALVLPWELTYVRYARPLWGFLGQNFGDLRVARFRERVFPKLGQDIVVLLARNKGHQSDILRFDVLSHPEELHAERSDTQVEISTQEAAGPSRPFQYGLIRPGIRESIRNALSEHCRPAGMDVRFNIGYVSGSKTFFHPEPEVQAEYGLRDSLIPTVADARAMRKVGLYTSSIKSPQQLFLPDTDNLAESAMRYVKSGEAAGVHLGYKCRVRKPWYRVPDVRRPEIILSVFSDLPIAMLNDGRYSASNSLLIATTQNPTDAVNRWYSRLTVLGTELAVHSLGGGVLVFVPNEASAIPIWQGKGARDVLPIVDSRLRAGDVIGAYSAHDEDLKHALGSAGLVNILEATEDLQRWRKRSK